MGDRVWRTTFVQSSASFPGCAARAARHYGRADSGVRLMAEKSEELKKFTFL
jgi:hypothetical protein